MVRICILGSCVSRDIFNLERAKSCEIVHYSARSSFASMLSAPPFSEDIYSQQLTSSFQRRMVRADLRKEFVTSFQRINADIILIDLIDERFSLVETRPGARFTLSAELQQILKKQSASEKTHIGGGIGAHRLIKSGTEEFMTLWREGWHHLLQMIKARGLARKIVINKVYWGTQTEAGEKFDEKITSHANQMLEDMYRELAKDLRPEQFLEYGDLLTCPDDHRWGPTPFHFSEKSQEFALEWIQQYHSGISS